MEALFIGHAYTDITFITDYMPEGDEKYVGQDYAFCVGGNAVVASFTCSKLGAKSDLIAQVAPDRLGDIFMQQCAKKGIRLFSREVSRSSVSFILPKDGKRSVLRCRDNDYKSEFPKISLDGYRALHIDGHQPQCALYYVKKAKEKGVLTSLDGGTVRENTDEILKYIDVAMVSEDFQKKMGLSVEEVIEYLHSKGVKVAGVTLGSQGYVYSEGSGIIKVPAFKVKSEDIKDTCGAGDIFHGAYVYSYLEDSSKSWQEHFEFASKASAISITRLGAEASIPTLKEIQQFKGN